MVPIADVTEVEAALEALANRAGGALITHLPREPGRRESRYAHLFGDAASRAVLQSAATNAEEPSGEASTAAPAGDATERRLAALEAEVRALRSGLDALRARPGGASD
jgi:uncharacterized protein YceH (UPF0502 family)